MSQRWEFLSIFRASCNYLKECSFIMLERKRLLEKYEFCLLVFSLLVNCNETTLLKEGLVLQCLPYKLMYWTFSCLQIEMDEKKECILRFLEMLEAGTRYLGSCTIRCWSWSFVSYKPLYLLYSTVTRCSVIPQYTPESIYF